MRNRAACAIVAMVRGVVVSVLVATALGLPTPAVAGPAEDPAAVLAVLNGQRAAAGVPPVTRDPQMDQGCLNHVDYGLMRGGWPGDAHDEEPGSPGYTDLGRDAARGSILGGDMLRGPPPFQHAPGHAYHLHSPFALTGGVGQRTEGALTLSCAWFRHGRPPASPPRAWSVPAEATTGVPVWTSHFESPPTLPFEVGLSQDPGGPQLTGPVVDVYQEDIDGRRYGDLCSGVLLGPGGEPVPGGAARRGQLVARDPAIPGARYRQVSTFGTSAPCGALQRTSTSTFTTALLRGIGDLVRLTDPYVGGDGHVRMRVELAQELTFYTRGNGTIRFSFTDSDFGPQTYRDAFWTAGGMELYLDHGPPGQVLTVEAIPDELAFGPTCFSPRRIVRRRYERTADGVVALGPQEVVAVAPDPCTAPPTVTALAPASGAPGAVVRVDGTAVSRAAQVRFGGVQATRWRTATDGALLVTVPNGAQDGALEVRTPFGTASRPFDVTSPDTTPPPVDAVLGPTGAVTTGTASFAFTVEPGDVASCRLDEAPWAPCSSPVQRTGLAPGAHTFAVRTTDPAGNVSPAPVTWSWTVTDGAGGTSGGGGSGSGGAAGGGAAGDGGTASGGAGSGGGPGGITDPTPDGAPPAGAGGGTPGDAGRGPAVGIAGARPGGALALRRGERILLRHGGLRLVGPARPRPKGRRLVLGRLLADRAGRVDLSVRAGRTRLLRLRRPVLRGSSRAVVVTLPKRRPKSLQVTLNGRRTALRLARR